MRRHLRIAVWTLIALTGCLFWLTHIPSVTLAGQPEHTLKSPGKMPPIHRMEDCCNVVLNPALKGRLGRLTVAYPGNAKNIEARMDVYKAGGKSSISSGYGNQVIELLPGTYDVAINGNRVSGVMVKSGHETQLKVGLLRVNAGKGTQVEILDVGASKVMVKGYGSKAFGFPVGTITVKIAGQSETVTISEGKVTDF